MPEFYRDGCITGVGAGKTIIELTKGFSGDLFSWSESWTRTNPGARVAGLSIRGNRAASQPQNALMFYDRNDFVFLDDLEIADLPGTALSFGYTRHVQQAFVRESHFRSIRLFNDGLQDHPVVDISSSGPAGVDGTNEIRMSQIDIYGPHGAGLAIRNAGRGAVRNISIEQLRIEGIENGNIKADLMIIGDPIMNGQVNSIKMDQVELIDPYQGYSALRVTASEGVDAPYHIQFDGAIGGGAPHGAGLALDACRSSRFRLTDLHTEGPSIIVSDRTAKIYLDGYGEEAGWRFTGNQSAIRNILIPALRKQDIR